MMRILLVVAVATVLAVNADRIGVLEITGNHYEIGQAIGHRFGSEIKARFENDADLTHVMQFMRTRAGSNAYSSYLATVETLYPDYVEEVKGMADGAGIDLHTMMAANMMAELGPLAGRRGITDCSDVLVKTAEQTLIGHNEDNDNATYSTSFIVRAHMTGNDSETTSYTSMHYPGQLAGDSFGFNEHGLAFSTNALFPTNGIVGGIPRVFLGRDLLNARDINDLIARVNRAQQRASGFSINVASIHDGRVFNLELAPTDFSVHEIHGSSGHFNQYLTLNNPHNVEPSSDHRKTRYDQMGEQKTARDIFDVLGDTQDKAYPLFRNGEAPDTAIVTIATALFDIRQRTLSVYTSNPKTATAPTLVFDITGNK